MFKRFNIYLFPALTVVCAVFLSVLIKQGYYPDIEKEAKSFQQDFHQLEQSLQVELSRAVEKYRNDGLEAMWSSAERSNGVTIHLYRNDSLKYWSSNQLPVLRYADIHFPSEGVNHLQNGWYYTKLRKFDDCVFASSFLIKAEYSYQNDDLVNEFSPRFGRLRNAAIGIDQNEGLKILNSSGNYAFSLLQTEQKNVDELFSFSILILLLLFVLFFILSLELFMKRSRALWWVVPVLIVLLRIWSIYMEPMVALTDDYSFSPALYSGNSLFSNVADYLINLIIIIFILKWLFDYVHAKRMKKGGAITYVVLLLITMPFWWLITYLIGDLVVNSQIPMSLNEVFSLDMHSVLVLLGWGVLLYFYYQLTRGVIKTFLIQDQSPSVGILAVIVLGLGYFGLSHVLGQPMFLEAAFPLVFMLTIYLSHYRSRDSRELGIGLLHLFVVSAVISIILGGHNTRKEHQERMLYADQLALDKDIEAEWNYAQMAKKIAKDKVIQKIASGEVKMSRGDFQENVERRFFKDFWERYEMRFELVSPDGKSVFEGSNGIEQFDAIKEAITKNGEFSQLDSSLIYLNSYGTNYNYVVQLPIENLDSNVMLFGSFRSKKIPEEIGFPRLLISKDANILKPLENYSIAKYSDGKLISQHGTYSYPSKSHILQTARNEDRFFQYEDHEHYYLKRNHIDEIVLSKKTVTAYDKLTAFSYLFSFYGFLLLPFMFRLRKMGVVQAMGLAMRIQMVLIFIVFITLMGFGLGSGVFIRSQYNQYTNDVISDKLSSVELEVKNKIGQFDRLSTADNRDYLQQILQKFAKVFFTDINLYDRDGYLLATSKQKLFNMGLVSEQINPLAYSNLTNGSKSKYVHQENIGKLQYASAYRPFYNNNGDHLAFINLQHFGQQSELEVQIEGFLVSIINIFILLLAVTVLLALVVSNWLTIPLRTLQESLTTIRFGKHNEPIRYERNDEIGSLVKEYNLKLEELAFTADQLAKSERESAWREMAKQVAHEIKNPLTPMKLSVQQLLRSFDPNDPSSRAKLERVANSIIEQIDALTNIANEFSNFAKLPKLNSTEVDIKELCTNVLTIFESEYTCNFRLTCPNQIPLIMGDREQLMRVLNNLIKNAVQSVPEGKKGEIEISLIQQNNMLIVRVKDNGVGISKEERAKLFVPYFTTKSTGTGLGLAMVKQIIENHGGSVYFESEKGKGSVFIVELPIDQKSPSVN